MDERMAGGQSNPSDKFAAHMDADRDLSVGDLLELCAEELELKSTVLDGLADGILVHTLDGTVLYSNPAASVVYGFDQEEFAKLGKYGWVPREASAAIGSRLAQLHATGVLDFQSRGLTRDGSTIATEVHARLIDLAGYGEAIVSVIQDITERLAAEETIQHLAFHDTLTGLPNRVLLDERLRMEMSSADRHDDLLGVVYLDLDAFKPINDTFGHATGDIVLRTVAQRLTNCLREYDTVARMGGDEFFVIFPRLKSREELAHLGHKVSACIEAPIHLDARVVVVTAKVGLAIYRQGEAPDELVSRADRAMYEAQALGVGGWQQLGPSD